jgi:hypothetical protein
MMKPAKVRTRFEKRQPKAGERQEGRDEALMVRFAFLLVGLVVVTAVYQTIAWLAG